MKIVKFRAAHLSELELQEGQAYFRSEFGNPDYGDALEQSAYSFSAIADGKLIACAGCHELWAGRAIAWALLSQDAGPHMRTIHRAAKGFIEQSPWRRIEMHVDAGFEAAHRWAKMLGMQKEGVMRAFSPTGVDYHLYSRIK